MSRRGQSSILYILVPVALLFLLATTLSAQNNSTTSGQPYDSLSEIVNKRRALLLVKRTSVVDVSGGRDAMIEEVLRAEPHPSRRYRLAYNAIAQKLNKFIRKHHNMSAVERVDEADYVIFFNLLEYRFPLGVPYPYGELFVIVKPAPGTGTQARVVWKSKKVQWAGDAADELIADLSLIWRDN